MSNTNLRTVGVIGGMGPAAAIDFVRTVMDLSGAERDEEHLPMLIANNTQIPNRQAALLRNGPSPGPAIAKTARDLERAGADVLVMPCNTAHAFVTDLLETVSIPFLSIIDVTVEACANYRRVGILATEGCLAFGGYQDALTKQGKQPLTQSDDDVAKLSKLIVRIKTGDIGIEVQQSMTALVHSLHEQGCDAIISGCTEIPMVLKDDEPACPVICSTQELAKATLNFARPRH